MRLRGKVVKYNAEIMGRNWLHIQDGSGKAVANNHDLTVTTKETVTLGQVVLIEGRLTLNRDIGAGYVYPVLIEDAQVLSN